MLWILFDVFINVLQISQAKKNTIDCQVLKLSNAGWLMKASLSLCCYHLCYLKLNLYFTHSFQCYYPPTLFDWEKINMRNSFHGRWVGFRLLFVFFFRILLWILRRSGSEFLSVLVRMMDMALFIYSVYVNSCCCLSKFMFW